MPTLPEPIVPIFLAFASLFRRGTFEHVKLLLVGALLTPGRRTVAAVLRTMGRADDPRYQNFHRVLNRNVWSARRAAGILLRQIVAAFVPHGEVVIGGDETLERRRGEKIDAKDVWYDPVRSSRSITVFSQGLRWLVFAVLTPVSWAGRVWALPFFTTLLTSPKHDEAHDRHHKSLAVVTLQKLAQVRRWLPGRKIVFVGDGSYAVIDLLDWCQQHDITLVTRLRMDAALYDPPAPRQPGQKGRPALVGARQAKPSAVREDEKTPWVKTTIDSWYGEGPRTVETYTQTALWKSSGSPSVAIRYVLIRPCSDDPTARFDPVCLACTDPEAAVEKIVGWYISRWQMENTFRESRAHLGVETQRQWSDKAIARTTPILFGLYSLVALMAHRLIEMTGQCPVRKAAWYKKENATFSDALALVRRNLWQSQITAFSDGRPIFHRSIRHTDTKEIQSDVIRLLTETLAYAA